MTVDVDAIKQQTDLQQIVANDLGAPKRTCREYWTWLCPLHADHDPSLVVYSDPMRGWWCYGCEQGGDVFEWMKARHGMDFKDALDRLGADVLTMTPSELAELAAERQRQAAEHRRQARQKRQQAAKLLAEADDHERWADELLRDSQALRFLAEKGVSEAVADHFHLGLKRDYHLGPAITIPWRDSRGRIRNVQYRVIDGEGDRRYRWDERGSRVSVFNAETVDRGNGPLLMVEGAIKAMVMVQHGFDAVALANKGGWRKGWAAQFQHRPVYVALDPDATEQAQRVAADIGANARVVRLPAKPDDLLVEYGWPADYIRWRMMRSPGKAA